VVVEDDLLIVRVLALDEEEWLSPARTEATPIARE
jgi:hypothetical protein